jgi:predicted  nucleic acid-binding Zn-ribbon protein
MMLSSNIKTLEAEISTKNCCIQDKNTEILELKDKILNLSEKLEKKKKKYQDVKRKYSKKLQLDMIDKQLLKNFNKPKSLQKTTKNDLYQYTICLAAALEDFCNFS